jgi:hypothetical protein
MSFPLGAQRNLMPTPPSSAASAVLSASGTAAHFDLRTAGPQAPNASVSGQDATGLPGHVCTFHADGDDVYVNFGSTLASVSSGNAPSPTATGANSAGNCRKLVKDQPERFYLRPGPNGDLFVGYVTASSTGTLRIFQESP